MWFLLILLGFFSCYSLSPQLCHFKVTVAALRLSYDAKCVFLKFGESVAFKKNG